MLQALENSSVGVLVRESAYGFQVVVAVHIIALMFSVGTLLWFDLRLVGVGLVEWPISRLYRRLLPWMIGGFVAMIVTGLMLFVGFATSAVGNTSFRVKMLAMVAAAVNAAVYHWVAEPTIADWDRSRRPPPAARAAGVVSMLLWATVVMAGRMISYTMF